MKIPYKLLWLAAVLVGLANLIWSPFTKDPACMTAAIVCGLACTLTFQTAWRK
jgi:hypothetical protein